MSVLGRATYILLLSATGLLGCGLLLDGEPFGASSRSGSSDAAGPFLGSEDSGSGQADDASNTVNVAGSSGGVNFATLSWSAPEYIGNLPTDAYACIRDCSISPDGRWLVASVATPASGCFGVERSWRVFPFDLATGEVDLSRGGGFGLEQLGMERDGEVFDLAPLKTAGDFGLAFTAQLQDGDPHQLRVSAIHLEDANNNVRIANINDRFDASGIFDGISLTPSYRPQLGQLVVTKPGPNDNEQRVELWEHDPQADLWEPRPAWMALVNAGPARDGSLSADGRAFAYIQDKDQLFFGGPVWVSTRPGPSEAFGAPVLAFPNVSDTTLFEGPSFAHDGTLIVSMREEGPLANFFCALARPLP